jgi:DegV family protein with EDD domain
MISVTAVYHATNYRRKPRSGGPAIARVAIISDSTACIPPDLAAHYGIDIIPLFLEFEDRVYQDGMSEDASDFYEALSLAKKPPTTAAPSPGAYADAIVRAAGRSDAVLCITVSRQFSAMYDAAVQGAALARERQPGIEARVLDSGAAAMAQGFVVLEAARAAQTGAAIDEVVHAAERLMPEVQLLVILDTLGYLAKSGRVPRLVIWASSPLQVKPIVQFRRGSYRPLAIVRTMPRAIERLVRALAERSAGKELHVCVHHTNAPQQAQALAERVRAELSPRELLISEFTQVMGVHTGPNLMGFAFFTKQ